MKRILTFFALAAMMMPVSCIKDDLAGPEMGNGSGKGMKFTAVMEVPGSKTTIDVSDGSVAWVAGDALKFDYAIGKTDSDPVISSNLAEKDIDKGSATFFAQIPQEFSLEEDMYTDTENPRYLYAAYPATLETTYTTAGNAYHLVIPTVQDGSFANASISVAKWNSAKPTAALEFKNLCGLISLTVGNNVRQIKLSSSGYIAGNANVGFDPVRVKNLTEGAASKEIIANVEGEGIYYIAVAPGTIKDLYIEFFDAEGNAVCDKLAKGDVTVERAHILPLGGFVDGSFAAKGGFFVKHDGKGDGSSWDNAADYTSLKNKLKEDAEFTVHMAAGTYLTAGVMAQGTGKAGANIKVLGGYPADAKGYSLSGRDPETNATILDGGHTFADGKTDGDRIWVLQSGTWEIDGLTFQNAYRVASATDAGSALIFNSGKSYIARNCKFINNVSDATASGNPGGIIRVTSSMPVKMYDCLFENNKVAKNGGAIYVYGASANLELYSCTFNGNTSGLAGGAIYYAGGTLKLTDCVFNDNASTTSGGAVYVNNTGIAMNNCQFNNNNSTEHGGAIYLYSSSASIKAEECEFKNNCAVKNGGAVYFYGSETTDSYFDDCLFEGNKVTVESGSNVGLGGAVGAASKIVVVDFRSTVFKENEASLGGGALWSRTGNYRISDCAFIDNKDKSCKADALYLDSSNGVSVYFNRCNIYYTKLANLIQGTSTQPNAILRNEAKNSVVAINNSVICGPWAVNNNGQIINNASGSKLLLVNTTMFAQTGYPTLLSNAGEVHVINSIVLNAASNGVGRAVTTKEKSYIYNTILTKADEGKDVETTDKTVLSETLTVVSNKAETFPVGPTWYGSSDSGADMWGNKYASSTTVNDCRGKYYYYAWDGAYPEGSTFTNATLAQVTEWVTNADANFATWLDGNLGKDIRGEQRDATSMWPGSYQE